MGPYMLCLPCLTWPVVLSCDRWDYSHTIYCSLHHLFSDWKKLWKRGTNTQYKLPTHKNVHNKDVDILGLSTSACIIGHYFATQEYVSLQQKVDHKYYLTLCTEQSLSINWGVFGPPQNKATKMIKGSLFCCVSTLHCTSANCGPRIDFQTEGCSTVARWRSTLHFTMCAAHIRLCRGKCAFLEEKAWAGCRWAQ